MRLKQLQRDMLRMRNKGDKGVEKARKYLKDSGLLAMPFDKRVGFCVLKKRT